MNKKNVYVTMAGRELPISPVSLSEIQMSAAGLQKEYIARGEPIEAPAPPTYEFETFGGGTETRAHDETTLRTDEDRAAWAIYQEAMTLHEDALARLEDETNRLRMEIIFKDGVSMQIPPGGAWEAEKKKRYVELPDDPEERRQQYILLEYLKTPMDIKACFAQVMIISAEGMDNQGAMEAALQSFLHPLESESGRNGREATEGSEDEEKPMVSQPASVTVEDGQGMGPAAE